LNHTLRRRALNPDGLEESMGVALRKLKVMSLTEAAAERLRGQLARSEKPVAGIRVGVKNGGCAGMSYTMDYVDEIMPFDEVVEDHGVTLIIDAKAVLFLLGTTLDVKADKFSSGFVFLNPNETSACGCGESVAIEPVKPEAIDAAAG
jgi:iron-sulfur cluster assembly protein